MQSDTSISYILSNNIFTKFIAFVSKPRSYFLSAVNLKTRRSIWLRQEKKICVFQVSRPYLGFCLDPKHFTVNCEQNVVNSAEKWGKMYWKMLFLYEIFQQNKMLCQPTIPSFFRAETHIYFFWPNGYCNGKWCLGIKLLRYYIFLVFLFNWLHIFIVSVLCVIEPIINAFCVCKICLLRRKVSHTGKYALWVHLQASCEILSMKSDTPISHILSNNNTGLSFKTGTENTIQVSKFKRIGFEKKWRI